MQTAALVSEPIRRCALIRHAPFPVCEAVGKDVVHHGILHPLRDFQPVGAQVEGKLEVIRALLIVGILEAVPNEILYLRSVIQPEVIGNAEKWRVQLDLVPVIQLVTADLRHGKALERELRGHIRPVGVEKAHTLEIVPRGAKAKDIGVFVYGVGVLAQRPMKNSR